MELTTAVVHTTHTSRTRVRHTWRSRSHRFGTHARLDPRDVRRLSSSETSAVVVSVDVWIRRLFSPRFRTPPSANAAAKSTPIASTVASDVAASMRLCVLSSSSSSFGSANAPGGGAARGSYSVYSLERFPRLLVASIGAPVERRDGLGVRVVGVRSFVRVRVRGGAPLETLHALDVVPDRMFEPRMRRLGSIGTPRPRISRRRRARTPPRLAAPRSKSANVNDADAPRTTETAPPPHVIARAPRVRMRGDDVVFESNDVEPRESLRRREKHPRAAVPIIVVHAITRERARLERGRPAAVDVHRPALLLGDVADEFATAKRRGRRRGDTAPPSPTFASYARTWDSARRPTPRSPRNDTRRTHRARRRR